MRDANIKPCICVESFGGTLGKCTTRSVANEKMYIHMETRTYERTEIFGEDEEEVKKGFVSSKKN